MIIEYVLGLKVPEDIIEIHVIFYESYLDNAEEQPYKNRKYEMTKNYID